jgi:nitrogen fixation/metabolism regulation signal transduction histidine kinase
MELQRELLLTIGALVLLHILLAFGVIGLFVRMGPAIERILQENVYSIGAAEQMLVALAESGDAAVSAERRRRIEDALQRAKNNVTEAEEVPVLHAIAQHFEAVIAGERDAKVETVREISRLISINRDAMEKVGAEAQRLGIAGAWAAVFVGFLSFAVSLVVANRLRRRFVMPLIELHEVFDTVRRGERYRRCRMREAPMEVMQVMQSVNMLLDECVQDSADMPAVEQATPERTALVALLERQPGGALIVDRKGQVVRANSSALETLAGETGEQLKQSLWRLAETGVAQGGLLDAVAFQDGSGWLCLLDARRQVMHKRDRDG